jgi:hypothetical protein
MVDFRVADSRNEWFRHCRRDHSRIYAFAVFFPLIGIRQSREGCPRCFMTKPAFIMEPDNKIS